MRAALPLVLLTLAALALRLLGIDHCVPHYKEADSNIALHAELIRAGVAEPDPQHNDAQYPILLAGLLSLVPSPQAAPGPEASLDAHLAAASRVYVETRIEMALLGVLTIPLTYLLARRFAGRGWSFFASALIAASFLYQFFAQQARPHVAATSVFLLAVLAAMRLAREPGWKSYALASLAAVAAIGTLQSGLAVLVPFFVAMLLVPLRVVHEPAGKLARRVLAAPVLVAAVAAVSFATLYPYLYFEGRESGYAWPKVEDGALVWGDHTLRPGDWKGVGFLTIGRTLADYEPVLLALLVVALTALFTRKRSPHFPIARWTDFWVAMSFALPYLVAIGLFRNTFERFLLPLLPFGAAFAAWGLEQWSARFGGRAGRAIAVLAVLWLALPGLACTRLAWLRSRDDTLELAAKWLAAQPDAAATPIHLTPFFDLPLARSKESLQPPDKRPAAIFSRWSIYQKRRGVDALPPPRFDLRYLVPRPDLGFSWPKIEENPQGYLRALGPGYFVLDMSRQPPNAGLDRLRAAARELGELVHRSAPEMDGPTSEFGYPFEDELVPDWPNPLTRALRIDAVGPVVEVYRVR